MKKIDDSTLHCKSNDLTKTSSSLSHLRRAGLRESGRLKVVRTAAISSPLVMGTIVGAVAMGFYGIANMIKYRRNEKSGAQAAKDTVTGSAGMGISTGLGIATANSVSGTLGSVVFVPLTAGAAVAYTSMAVWDKLFYKWKHLSKTK